MRGITSDSLMDGTLLSGGAIDMPNNAENPPIREAPTTQSRDDSLPDVAPVPFPIAIVGMAMRLPGGVSNETEFWDFLVNKRDGLCKVPEDRYNIDAFYDESKPGHVRTQHGYFLQNDIGQVDNAFFGISKTEAGKLDPQQRLLMEVIWECMENGGQTQWRGKKIGCYVGVFGEDWLDLMSKDVQNNDRYRVMSAGDFAISNRVSYEYDLGGPSMTIRTGCSSSMVGLHEACQGIYSGECSSALVAGTNIIITPTMTTSMSDNMVLSPSGICRTFDAAADGYGRGEAINALFIKPLSQAMKDGDPIRAVIRSTAVNCDGRTPSITTPGSEAQERLVRAAYRKAQIEDFCKTAFFECHGTGTIVGDFSEASVVAKVFKEKGIYMGAVKPNVGHSEGASAITSIIKTVLALEHKTIPPNVYFEKPNPKISFKEAKLQVPVEATPWPKDRIERASVNSFGIGGTNAHLVLDSASSYCQEQSSQAVSRSVPGPQLLLLSAKSTSSLNRKAEEIKKYLQDRPAVTPDLAYTLAMRREHMQHRAFALAEEGVVPSFEKFQSSCPSTVFVFTGQGAQWPGMGKDLISRSERFRGSIQIMNRALQGLKNAPEWNIEDELLKCEGESRVQEAAYAQPLSTAVQVALVDALRDWGIVPTTVVGHSSGEIAASYASGAISADVAIVIAYFRGQALKTRTSNHPGAMAAVSLSPEQAKNYLKEGVTIACENSPQSVTLSGDEEVLLGVIDQIKKDDEDILCKRLAINAAYHSHHMYGPGEAYESLMHSHISYNDAMVPLYSTATGTVILEPSKLNAAYWRLNLQSPVLFNTAIQRILGGNEEAKLFLEIGPHSALSAPLRQIFQSASGKQKPLYVPTLRRGADSWKCLLMAAGHLYAHGAPIELSTIIPGGSTLTDIPPYSWDHEERFWSETRVTRDWRLHQARHHELLGSRILGSSDVEPSWRNILQFDTTMWLLDHRIQGQVIFPCAGYVAMVGEAIRQVTGSTDYSVRNLFMRTALVLSESENVELMTTLRPAKLSDDVDSVWHDFTITSYRNGSWKKHCAGQVRGGSDETHAMAHTQPFIRSVQSEDWYSALNKRGLEYGQAFRGLKKITASPSTLQAAAVLQDEEQHHTSYYALHPIMIDQCLQLLSVAATQGISRRMTRLCIPTSIESLFISPGRGSMSLSVGCEMSGMMNGNATLISNNRVVLSMGKGLFFSVPDSDMDEAQVPLASTLHWKPDIEFVPPERQFPHVRKIQHLDYLWFVLARLVITETYHQTRSLTPSSEHLKKYLAFIESQYEDICSASSDLLPEMRDVNASDPRSRRSQIEKIIAMRPDCDVYDYWPRASKPFKLILDRIGDIIEGNINPLELLMEDNALRDFYGDLSVRMYWDGFLSLLSHSNPTLRVLEIGAGTGATTELVLKGLACGHKGRMYTKYTFTDISPGFIPDAKDRFRDYQGLEYTTLDISQDPMKQGFEPESYDLVVASNVLHATPSISETLSNVRKLIAPGGHFLLQEICNYSPSIDYIMGLLPGWWVGEQDGREDRPYISTERWHNELVEAGFTGNDMARLDGEDSYYITASILSRPQPKKVSKGNLYLLYRGAVSQWARNLEKQLTLDGYAVYWYAFQQTPPPDSDVISLIDLESPFFDDLSSVDFAAFKQCFSAMKNVRLLWVTRLTQMECEDPRFGLSLGLVRTCRHEIAEDFVTLEIDQLDSTAIESVVKVLNKIKSQREKPWLYPDFEFALRDGVIHTPRFQWSTIDDQLTKNVDGSASKALDIGTYGVIGSLIWASASPSLALAEDVVEVDVKHVGLNFRDTLVMLGLLGDMSECGLEGSGVVRRVGSSVQDLKVGDYVILASAGLLCTRKVLPANKCLRLPDNIKLQDAATILCVFTTAIHSLVNLGNLQKGQSVLIHAACGGVGLAAIQVCRMIGANIYATVGSKEKRQHLTETLGIPEDHIFDSRSPSFLQGVMAKTGDRGVDLVLNSLSGELLRASWKCVATFGKMLELGKRDFLGHGQLDMSMFSGNRSFIGVDLLHLSIEDPQASHQVAQQCVRYFQEGKLKPIQPITAFKADEIAKAVRYMQTGQHMGKIVIQLPDDSSALPVSKIQEGATCLRTDVSYLLVGGLGGIGRAVARWMVEKGARHLVFLSRSGQASPESQSLVRDLESQDGCTVTVVAGSVANIEDVRRAVAACKKPIGGVMQMTMVLKDQLLMNMEYEEWIAALAPKVQGTWNLHNALGDTQLDFFVLFSSLSGICGLSGQTNYAAANTFLGSFARYRQSRGLTASVLDIGFMGDVGYVFEKATDIREKARAVAFSVLEEKDLLKGLEAAILSRSSRRPSQLAIGLATTRPLSDPGVIPVWRREARFAPWENVLTASNGLNVDLKHQAFREFLITTENNPALLDDPSMEVKVTTEIGRMIASHMSYPKDMEVEELAKVSIDSLMAIEIRSWCRRHAGIEVPVTDISNAENVGCLSKIVIKILREKYDKAAPTGSQKASIALAAPPDEFELLRQDANLGKTIQPVSGPVPDWLSENEGRVFLTGATKFLGSSLLSFLMRLPQVKTIACLIRTPDAETGLARVKQALTKYGFTVDSESKLHVIPGDLTDPTFGLGQEKFDELAQWASVVFHDGVYVNYILPYFAHRAINTIGLLHILHFVSHMRLKPMHFVSSIAAAGSSGILTGKDVGEDQRPALDTERFKQHVGYTQSKVVQESIVWDAIDRGYQISIYRPGLIMGHSSTGVGNPNDLTNRLMYNCILTGCYPNPPRQRNQFVPVDYVALALIQISLSNANLGHAYNLVHPDQAETTLVETFEALSACCPSPLQHVSSTEWVQEVVSKGQHKAKMSTSMLEEQLSQFEILWGGGSTGHMPLFRTDNVRRALAGCPEVLEVKSVAELVKTYYPQWVDMAKS